MFLSEHVLYGSSRLGTSTYNQKMGYASGSLAYPAGPGFNVCYTESDEVESDREPMGGQTTGPIGGNWETIKPYGPHKVPETRIPIVGVNLPWAGSGDVTTKPTKQPTTFVPGRKRYEFSNHLGSVLVTVSDKPLGVDGNSDGIAEHYMPDVKTTSDYEPFGAPLKERTLTEANTKPYFAGFNGQTKDDELHGEGNAYAFEYRIHDARIGRFLSVDPLAPEYPWNSTYAFAENNVIWCIDLEGAESGKSTKKHVTIIMLWDPVTKTHNPAPIGTTIKTTTGSYTSGTVIEEGDPAASTVTMVSFINEQGEVKSNPPIIESPLPKLEVLSTVSIASVGPILITSPDKEPALAQTDNLGVPPRTSARISGSGSIGRGAGGSGNSGNISTIPRPSHPGESVSFDRTFLFVAKSDEFIDKKGSDIQIRDIANVVRSNPNYVLTFSVSVQISPGPLDRGIGTLTYENPNFVPILRGTVKDLMQMRTKKVLDELIRWGVPKSQIKLQIGRTSPTEHQNVDFKISQ